MAENSNYDFLKPVLGDDLFAQFAEKMGAAQGVTLANIADGSYIPKVKFDSERTAKGTALQRVTQLERELETARQSGADTTALQQQIDKLTQDIAARDKTIADIGKRGKVLERMRADGFRNPDTAIRLIDLEKIGEDESGKMTGYDDQLAAIKKSDPYLLGTIPGGRAGLLGGGAGGPAGPDDNQQINNALRRASGRM